MNRNEYMKELEQALKRLPKAEREEALSYYNEYFDDAGPEREAEVMEELGDAKGIATQIVKEVALKRLAEPKQEILQDYRGRQKTACVLQERVGRV